MVRFSYGEVVRLRHFQHDQVGGFYSLRSVRHDDAGMLLWGTEGSRYWQLNMPDGRRLGETPLPEWVATPKIAVARTVGHSMLSWHPVAARYSIRFFFRLGVFTNWYANLEVPAIAWRAGSLAGIDTVDWDLDVWVDPDRNWRFKDEEEFESRLRTPDAYWVRDEAEVRAAGAEVVALVEAGVFPFDGTWCDFQPDDDWGPIVSPALPSGWDRPRVRGGG